MEIVVRSLFVMPPSYIFEGIVLSGQITIGQRVRIYSPLSYFDARVRGVEIERKIVPRGERGQTVALMFDGIDLTKVSDGFTTEKDSFAVAVNSLTIRDTPKMWWQFWR